MYYKIVEKFGPEDGDKWEGYLEWRGLNLIQFDSVDGILRPDLFTPESKEDWNNCVNEDFKLNLITNLKYANNILKRFDNSVLVGVEIELQDNYSPKLGILGFDIIDGYCDVSLITNWGNEEKELIDKHVLQNGLIRNLDQAIRIRNILRDQFSEDSHAEACEVWAVYEINT
jgi:hypothetical protein